MVDATISIDQCTGNPRLLINTIYDMQSMRENFVRKLQLTLASQELSEQVFGQLQQLFLQTETTAYPIVVKYFADATAELRLEHQWHVALSDENLATLRQVLGKNSVSLVFS